MRIILSKCSGIPLNFNTYATYDQNVVVKFSDSQQITAGPCKVDHTWLWVYG